MNLLSSIRTSLSGSPPSGPKGNPALSPSSSDEFELVSDSLVKGKLPTTMQGMKLNKDTFDALRGEKRLKAVVSGEYICVCVVNITIPRSEATNIIEHISAPKRRRKLLFKALAETRSEAESNYYRRFAFASAVRFRHSLSLLAALPIQSNDLLTPSFRTQLDMPLDAVPNTINNEHLPFLRMHRTPNRTPPAPIHRPPPKSNIDKKRSRRYPLRRTDAQSHLVKTVQLHRGRVF